MSNVQCRDDKSRVEQIRVVDGNVVIVRWYSEAHLRVFDRLDKRNDYRMVVMMSCELRRPRWSKKIEDKENEIRYNDMGTFFCIFEKNVTRTMSWIESTWDEVDQRELRVGQDQVKAERFRCIRIRRCRRVDVSDQSNWHRGIGERSSPGAEFLMLGR